MKPWLRRLRGMAGIGAMWGIACSVLGVAVGVLVSVIWPEILPFTAVRYEGRAASPANAADRARATGGVLGGWRGGSYLGGQTALVGAGLQRLGWRAPHSTRRVARPHLCHERSIAD
jgi:hypothetical protein